MSDPNWSSQVPTFYTQPSNATGPINIGSGSGGPSQDQGFSLRSDGLASAYNGMVDNLVGSPANTFFPASFPIPQDRNEGPGIPIPNPQMTQGTPDFRMTPFLQSGGHVIGTNQAGSLVVSGSWNQAPTMDNSGGMPGFGYATQQQLSSSPPTAFFGAMNLGQGPMQRDPRMFQAQQVVMAPMQGMQQMGPCQPVQHCYIHGPAPLQQQGAPQFFGQNNYGQWEPLRVVQAMPPPQPPQEQYQRAGPPPNFGQNPRRRLIDGPKTLADIIGEEVYWAKDQNGSRFIQQKLEKASVREKQRLFVPILEHAEELIDDVFGNYVIQKYFEYGSEEQKKLLAEKLRGKVVDLAMTMYGCRVLQKAIEFVGEKQQSELIGEMQGAVLRMLKDQNGNHVVQKVVEKVAPQKLQFVVDAFTQSPHDTVLSLSMHTYGCRVIQRILEHCTEDQKKPILDILYLHVQELIFDQYGNYVIQHLMEKGTQNERDRFIKEVISGDLLRMCKNKCASNVIEKCLMVGSPEQRSELIDRACGNPNDPTPPLVLLMQDGFGNYVVQKMLDVADSKTRKQLTMAIKPHIQTLRKFNSGKHIVAKLEKYFQRSVSTDTTTSLPEPSSSAADLAALGPDFNQHPF